MKLAYWMYAGPAHIGTLRVASSFKNVHAIMHAPLGDDYFNVMRSMLERERDFTPVTTSIVDRHVLARGSQEKVVQNIQRKDKEERPDLILLTPTCTSSILQEDLQNFVNRASNESICDVLLADVNHYRVNELQAADRTLEQIVRFYLEKDKKAYEQSNTLYQTEKTVKPSANILGIFTLGFHNQHDCRELKRLLNELGIVVNEVIPEGGSVTSLKNLPKAWFNIVPYRETGLMTAIYLEKEYNMPYTSITPMGVVETAAFIREIKEICTKFENTSSMSGSSLSSSHGSHGVGALLPEASNSLSNLVPLFPSPTQDLGLDGPQPSRGEAWLEKETVPAPLMAEGGHRAPSPHLKKMLEAKPLPILEQQGGFPFLPPYDNKIEKERVLGDNTYKNKQINNKNIESLILNPQKVETFIKKQTQFVSQASWFSRSIDCQNLTDKKTVVFGDATHAASMTKILVREMGIHVVCAGTYCKHDADWFREQVSGFCDQILITDDHSQIADIIAQISPAAIFGTQMERHVGKRLDIPCGVISAPVHIQNFPLGYRPFLGYEGTNQISDLVYNSFSLGMEDHLLEIFNGHDNKEVVTRSYSSENQIEWSKEALNELSKVPGFVRGKVKRNTEKYAQSQKITLINLEAMYAAKEAVSA
uniref:Light-independent protochlorophyllide reductase subunit B n=1 Tax=Haematococcus lacustris TaxID=44745 RepID=A0A2K9YRP7_HAELA|nr:light-independent protochlorophyllide reductase subunit B [Haematococcus lacustris]AUW36429.1 light-independent protochlorophyllide reductase subunit B [Haematococcus lacustris]UMB51689.1 protochlorophyllide reductase subunit B [Haematococcus lacustris]